MPRDIVHRGRQYNTFGFDPNGHLAAIAATLYGPTYTAGHDVKHFVGKPEPPDYGPPAPFQLRELPCLSDGMWKPTCPPRAPAIPYQEKEHGEDHFRMYIDPPVVFVPSHFDALYRKERQRESEDAVDGYETEEVDEAELTKKWRQRRLAFLPRICQVEAVGPQPQPQPLHRKPGVVNA
ncbi:hypothetical protein DXG01_016436 [Tephrocybe rancida]|nr:hypothetical protein DXG01_016436 [Tephrocybe rancida]